MSINILLGYTTWRHSQLHIDGLYAVLQITKIAWSVPIFLNTFMVYLMAMEMR